MKLFFFLLISCHALSGIFVRYSSSYRASLLMQIFLIFGFLLFYGQTGRIKYRLNWILVSLVIITLLIFHLFISINISGNESLERSISSILYLIIIIISSIIILSYIRNTPATYIKSIMQIFLGFFLITGFIDSSLDKSNKSMMFFQEPSHYALVLLPYVIHFYIIHYNKIKSLLLLFALISLSFLLENATLLIESVLFYFLICWIKSHNKMIPSLLLTIPLTLILINGINYDYFLQRINFFQWSYTENISVLVYLSGWERACLSLIDTYYLGVGFNRMGFVGPIGNYQDVLSKFDLHDLNIYDGGSTGSKLIAELGLLGVLILIFYIRKFYHIIRLKLLCYEDVFFVSFYLSFVIEAFVRGVGYYSPNLIFFISSLFYLFRDVVVNKYQYFSVNNPRLKSRTLL